MVGIRFKCAGWLQGLVLLCLAAAVPAEVNFPELPRGKGESCVEPTDVMRSDHMEFLLHQRDDTVHRGIRTSRHSLVECIACHVQTDDRGQFIPVNAQGQFCQGCHEFTATKMDCFDCHATVPDGEDHTTGSAETSTAYPGFLGRAVQSNAGGSVASDAGAMLHEQSVQGPVTEDRS